MVIWTFKNLSNAPACAYRTRAFFASVSCAARRGAAHAARQAFRGPCLEWRAARVPENARVGARVQRAAEHKVAILQLAAAQQHVVHRQRE